MIDNTFGIKVKVCLASFFNKIESNNIVSATPPVVINASRPVKLISRQKQKSGANYLEYTAEFSTRDTIDSRYLQNDIIVILTDDDYYLHQVGTKDFPVKLELKKQEKAGNQLKLTAIKPL